MGSGSRAVVAPVDEVAVEEVVVMEGVDEAAEEEPLPADMTD